MPHYGRAVLLWRELVHDIGTGAAGALASEDVARELSDLVYLADTVQMLAGMLEVNGQTREAEDLRRQLTDDVAGLAARLAGPARQKQRRKWAQRFVTMGQRSMYDNNDRVAELSYRLALILDPDNGWAHNNLAWMLVRTPCDRLYDPTRGLTLARRAVALEPNDWRFLNTLGVAEYRDGDFETAADTLRKSTTFTGGSAHDWYFLAMTCWHQGKKTEAAEWFDRAVASANKSNSPDYLQRDLRQFHAEAAALMGLTGPKPEPKNQRGEKNEVTRQTAKKAGGTKRA